MFREVEYTALLIYYEDGLESYIIYIIILYYRNQARNN